MSAVSYSNSKPFVYGLQHSEIIKQIDLSLDIPSDCAQKLIENQVDIGLIPVAALLNRPEFEIISDYCIGADGAVNSVFIFSDLAIQDIRTIRLDPQSRTSNQLALLLLKNYWHVSPRVVFDDADAFVLIGDQTFNKKSQFAYAYDLAAEWKQFTGLPFAFAVWAANKPMTEQFKNEFNAALKFGLDNRLKTIEQKQHNGFDLNDYLLNKLDFDLNPKKRQAIDLFLSYLK